MDFVLKSSYYYVKIEWISLMWCRVFPAVKLIFICVTYLSIYTVIGATDAYGLACVFIVYIYIHIHIHIVYIYIYIYIESGFGSILLERWCFLSDESDLYHLISLCTLYVCVYSKCNDKSHIISMFVWKTSHDLACFIYVNRMCMAKTYF